MRLPSTTININSTIPEPRYLPGFQPHSKQCDKHVCSCVCIFCRFTIFTAIIHFFFFLSRCALCKSFSCDVLLLRKGTQPTARAISRNLALVVGKMYQVPGTKRERKGYVAPVGRIKRLRKVFRLSLRRRATVGVACFLTILAKLFVTAGDSSTN